MGIDDSSKTRVQPILGALAQSDPSGATWLGRLLRLGNHGNPPNEPGTLVEPPSFEFAAPPPRAFLRWMVEHPEELSQPRYKTSEVVRAMRERLIGGDRTAREQALEAIDSGALHRGQWWCFEGTTMVDCALFTDRCVVFIEGKRTERGASTDVSWYSGRNQVLRNLDCARALTARGDRDYYTLLVIEEAAEDDPRLKAARQIVDDAVVERSLPHLSPDERLDALNHYLGCTTWQEIRDTFRLGPIC